MSGVRYGALIPQVEGIVGTFKLQMMVPGPAALHFSDLIFVERVARLANRVTWGGREVINCGLVSMDHVHNGTRGFME